MSTSWLLVIVVSLATVLSINAANFAGASRFRAAAPTSTAPPKIGSSENSSSKSPKRSAPNAVKPPAAPSEPTTTPTTLDPEALKRPPVDVPILMYHHIRDFDNPQDQLGTRLSVSPARFREHLKWLVDNGYQSITLDDMVKVFNHQLTPKKKPVVITFDDGYEDSYTEAFPALQEYGQVGVFYIVTRSLGEPGRLSREQVSLLNGKGMQIAAHTASHVDLPNATPDDRLAELTESKQVLEKLLGKPVVHLCYPAGRVDDVTVETVRAAGYLTAVTTVYDVATYQTNPLQLPRYRITNGSFLDGILP